MSDDFIPLNQSTPVHQQWNQDRNENRSGFQNENNFHGRRRPHKQWNRNNFSRNNSSFSSDVSYSDNSYNQTKHSIDAYLHPSMLRDPWESLRKKENNGK